LNTILNKFSLVNHLYTTAARTKSATGSTGVREHIISQLIGILIAQSVTPGKRMSIFFFIFFPPRTYLYVFYFYFVLLSLWVGWLAVAREKEKETK
jgi:hypothetical protein